MSELIQRNDLKRIDSATNFSEFQEKVKFFRATENGQCSIEIFQRNGKKLYFMSLSVMSGTSLKLFLKGVTL